MTNDEWITPPEWITPARALFGGTIDLDPASTFYVNAAIVNAEMFYSQVQNSLALPWWGKVWLNPPYSMPLIQEFVYKLSGEFQSGAVTEAILLVNTATETQWYKHCAKRYPLALSERRIRFLSQLQNDAGTLRPIQVNGFNFYRGDQNRVAQTLFYLGANVKGFYSIYQHLTYCPTGSVRPFIQEGGLI